MGSSTPSARTRARERMASKLAEQRRREQELQDRLEKFLKAQDSVDTARGKRDAAIAKAERDFAAAKDAVDDERAGHIAAMRQAGQSPTDIAELTGLTAKEVRTLARRATTHGDDAKQSDPPNGSSEADSADTAHAGDAGNGGTAGAAGDQPSSGGVPAAS